MVDSETLLWARLQPAIRQSHACCAALLYGSRSHLLLSKLHYQQLPHSLQLDILGPCSASQPLAHSSSAPCQLSCRLGTTPARACSAAPDQHWGCRRGHLRSVFQRQLEDKAAQVAAQQGLQLRYSPEVLDFLVSKVRAVAARLSTAPVHALGLASTNGGNIACTASRCNGQHPACGGLHCKSGCRPHTYCAAL